MERLGAACARAQRSGVPCASVVFDLDGFKEVNDRFGHHVGDEVFHGVVARLHRELRSEQVLARYGGGELFVVAQGSSKAGEDEVEPGGDELVRRLVATLPAHLLGVAGHYLALRAWSIGTAVWPGDGRGESS